MAIEAAQVDPRDTAWEVAGPAYRVYFYDSDQAADEWRLTGASSVKEILDWADGSARGRRYVIYVEVNQLEPGLIRLDGIDPNAM